VYAFSKDYDYSTPYLPPVNESLSVRLDSTFQPDPPEGWFGLGNASGIQPPILALNYFQTAPWFHLAFDDVPSDDLGSRNKAAAVSNPLGALVALGNATATGGNSSNASSISISPILENVIDSDIAGIVTNAAKQAGWSGILGDMDPMLFFNVTVNQTTYFNYLNDSYSVVGTAQNGITLETFSDTGFSLAGLQPLSWFNDTTLTSDDDLDDLISNDILQTLQGLTAVNATSRGVRLGYWAGAILRYPAVAAAIQVVSNMPWGVLRFSEISNESYSYTLQAGTDSRLENVFSYPSEGLKRMAFQTMFSRAISLFPHDGTNASEIKVECNDNSRLQNHATVH